MGEALKRKKTAEVIKDTPPLSKATEKAEKNTLSLEQLARIESFLSAEGVIRKEYIEILGREIEVIDIERLKRDRSLDNKAFKNRTLGSDEVFISKRDTLFQLLEGRSGLTSEQVQNEDYVEKPFLYIPETADTATSTRRIKNAKFHAGMWELSEDKNSFSRSHPVQLVESEGVVSEGEARIAILMFHPQYGDAFRDEEGSLLMRDFVTREYVSFSWSIMDAYGVSSTFILGANSDPNRSSSVQEGIKKRLPNLVKKGLLVPDRDVRVISRREGETKEGLRKRLPSTGAVMINRVLHHVGKGALLDEDHIVQELTPKLGALVDPKTGRITHTFTIFTQSEVTQTEAGNWLAGGERVGLTPIEPEKFTHPKRTYESEVQYRARVHIVDKGLQLFLKAASGAPGLESFIRNSGARSHVMLGNAIRFVEETSGGENAFSALASQLGSDEDTTQQIFSAYGDLIEAADTAEDFVRTNLECVEAECIAIAQRVRANMLSRSQNLLTSSVRAKDLSGIKEKLKHFKVGATLFAGAFKALKEQSESVDWEYIKDASFEQVEGKDLSKADRSQMQQIWESHYAGKYTSPELEASLRQEFMEAFKKENLQFYLFKYKGEIVSYFSSEITGSRDGVPLKHLASFMTSQSYEGGSLGLAVMEKGLEEEQKGAILVGESDVDPVRTPIVSKYFEEYNFIAVRVYEDHGEPTLALERLDGVRFDTKRLSRAEIRLRADLVAHGAYEGHINEKYVVHDELPNFKEYLTDSFVLTRYFTLQDKEANTQKYYAVFEKLPSAPSSPAA